MKRSRQLLFSLSFPILLPVLLLPIDAAAEVTTKEAASDTATTTGKEECAVLATPPWEESTFQPRSNNPVTCNLDPFSLREDLRRYPTISREDVDRAESLYGKHARRVVIKDNVLYARTCHTGGIIAVGTWVENFIARILKLVKVPDCDFVLNASDYPQNRRQGHRTKEDAPLLSMCGSYNFRDIVIPTYKIVQTNTRKVPDADPMPWEERKSQLLWRGSDSSRIRFKFNKKANEPEYKGLTDVGIHQMIRIPHDEEKHGPVKPSVRDYRGYKWVANIDGSVAAYRMPQLAAQGSAVVLHESEYYEHWYRDLVPYKHYVPMAGDFSNLTDVLEWLQTHDDEAKQIGSNLRQFALEHLSPASIKCFFYVFFYEYAARMTYEPTVLENMEKVVV